MGTLPSSPACPQTTLSSSAVSKPSGSTTKASNNDYNNFSDFWQQMSHGLLLKKKEQHIQHQLMMQQQQQLTQLQHHHHSFPSPITPTYDKKVFSSPSSSCRFDGVSSNGSSASNHHTTEVSSNASLYSSPSSSTTSTPSSSASNQRHSYGQFPFNDVYGSSGTFLSSSYAAAAALGTSHHDLTRSCSALPSPTIYPPTPPPSTPWIHPAWFGSMETAGYMKTPKTNPFDN